MIDNNLIQYFVPMSVPIKNSGNISVKVRQKTDYQRSDGTCALYVDVVQKGKHKKLPLNIAVTKKDFNKKTQLVKNNDDYNIIIKNTLKTIYSIEVNYRLRNLSLDLETLDKELKNPSQVIDFVKFYETQLEEQKHLLKISSYKQQKSVIEKLKNYQPVILFSELNEDFYKKYLAYLKNVMKNKPLTITSAQKNIKKYLHLAHKKGIHSPLNYADISVPRLKSERTFLNEEELQKMKRYYTNEFIPLHQKKVLKRFLFSCYTGLRISDIKNLTKNNIIDKQLAFSAQKTGKFLNLRIPDAAFEYIDIENEKLWDDNYTEQFINSTLKDISRHLNIKKKISFHVARHTFATRFLRKGGTVQILKEALQHTKLDETMIYVHIVAEDLAEQMQNLD